MTKILHLPSGTFIKFNGWDGEAKTEIIEHVHGQENVIKLIEMLTDPNSEISEWWLEENNLIRPILRSELEIIDD